MRYPHFALHLPTTAPAVRCLILLSTVAGLCFTAAPATALSPKWRRGPLPRHAVNAVVVSPDGLILASGGDAKTVRLWNIASGRLQSSLPTAGSVVCLAFSTDGSILACGGSGVRLWNRKQTQYKPLLTLSRDVQDVQSIAFSPKGDVLAGAVGRKVHVWEVAGGLPIRSFWEASNGIRAVSYSPEGMRLATGGGLLRLWKAQEGTPDRPQNQMPQTRENLEAAQKRSLLWEGGSSSVSAVAFSPDGRAVASASNNIVALWNAQTGRLLQRLVGQQDVNAIAFSSDGAMIAGAGEKGVIWLWEAATGRLMGVLPAHGGAVRSLAFVPNTLFLASGGEQGPIVVWNTTTRKIIRTFSVS